MKKLYTLISLVLVGGAVSAQNIAAQKGLTVVNQNQHVAAPHVSPAATGDTLFYCDGYNFYVTDPADMAAFNIANDDIDQKTVASAISASFGPTSAFKFFYTLDANNDTVNYFGATSWFSPVGQADNWFTFGPITIPAAGARLQWQHAMPDNSYRDGYEVLLSTTGLVNYTDFTSPAIYTVGDNSTANNGDTDLVAFEMVNIPNTYNGQQVYVAFHHNANDMFILYLDEISIIEQPTGITETANDFTVGQNMPNPASDVTAISYSLKNRAEVMINIYDVTGKNIMTFNQGEQNSGNYSVNVNTASLTAGIYYYTVKVGENQITKKMSIVK